MLDTSRKFYPSAAILRTIDGLAANRMNVLHWHVTDGESMPIESKLFPQLAKLGSFASPEGVYTQADVAKIVQYGLDRGVRVVVEFDMPSHNWAFSPALPHLFCNCSSAQPLATEFWQDAFNPTLPELYEFLDAFIGEMSALFP